MCLHSRFCLRVFWLQNLGEVVLKNEFHLSLILLLDAYLCAYLSQFYDDLCLNNCLKVLFIRLSPGTRMVDRLVATRHKSVYTWQINLQIIKLFCTNIVLENPFLLKSIWFLRIVNLPINVFNFLLYTECPRKCIQLSLELSVDSDN